MDSAETRFRFVGKEGNDGGDPHTGKKLVQKAVIDIVGEEGIDEMLTEKDKALAAKEFVYGESTIENEETLYLPEEIYFKDSVTGAIVSSTRVDIEEVLESKLDLVLYDKKNPTYHLKAVKDIEQEFYAKYECKESHIFDNIFEAPHILRFRPTLTTVFPDTSD